MNRYRCIRTAGRYLRYGLVAALMFVAVPARAASVSFFLDQSNALSDGVNYLQVTIDDEGNPGDINFTVDVLNGALTPGSNFGIQKFSFNGYHLLSSNILFTGASTAGWQVANNNGSMSEFGKFSNVLATTGNYRSDPLTFSIVGIDGDVITSYATGNVWGQFFAAHVAGFTNFCGTTSAFFAGSEPAPVPLPPAVWLFGSGLAGLFGLASRRRVTTLRSESC